MIRVHEKIGQDIPYADFARLPRRICRVMEDNTGGDKAVPIS